MAEAARPEQAESGVAGLATRADREDPRPPGPASRDGAFAAEAAAAVGQGPASLGRRGGVQVDCLAPAVIGHGDQLQAGDGD